MLQARAGKRAHCTPFPGTIRALDAYLGSRNSGPLFVAANDWRMVRSAAWPMVGGLTGKEGTS